MIAGCGGDSGEDPEPTTEQPGGSPMDTPDETAAPGDDIVDQAFVIPSNDAPSDQFTMNEFASTGIIEGYDQVYGRLIWYDVINDEWPGEFVDSYDDIAVSDDAVEVTLRDDLNWSNGDQVTAEDFRTQQLLINYISNNNPDGGFRPEDPFDSITVTGDTSFQFDLTSPVNKQLFTFEYLQGSDRLFVHRGTYGQWLERFEDTTSADEHEQVRLEITGAGEDHNPWELSIEDAVANSAFKVAAVQENRVLLERNEEYVFADNVNFSQIEYRFMPEDQTIWQGLASGEVHGVEATPIPEQVMETFPEYVYENFSNCWCDLGVMFQHRDPWIGRRNVRRALAHLINREEIVQVVGARNRQVIEIPSGVKARQDYWLGDQIDNFRTYSPYESNEERAAELLEEEGFSKEDGTWYTPDGDAWGFPLKTNTNTDWTNFFQVIGSQLQDAGIQAELQTQDFSTWIAETWETGDFPFGVNFVGGWNPHPQRSYNRMLRSVWGVVQKPGYGVPDGHEPSDPIPDQVIAEVPMPIGDHDGTVEEIDMLELLANTLTTTDEDEAVELIRTLAWITNYDLPHLPIMIKGDQNWLTNRVWDIPDYDHYSYKIDPGWEMRYQIPHGLVTANPEKTEYAKDEWNPWGAEQGN